MNHTTLPRLPRGLSLCLLSAAMLAACSGGLPRVATAAEADSAPWPVPVAELEKSAEDALGDAFEFLGSELKIRAADVGGKSPERLLWIKARAKRAGQFALVHSFDFEYPEEVKKNWRTPDRGQYVIPLGIAERGTPRLFQPGGFGGPARPHANVGDVLRIPLRVDRFRTRHKLAAAGEEEKYPKIFFDIRNESDHADFVAMAAEKPVVRNDAAEQLKLLASWRNSFRDRPGINEHHSLQGYFEFTAPGEFNLFGRPARAEDEAAADSVPLRVMKADAAVTVMIVHAQYTEHRGKSRSISSEGVPCGTLEARVGDRILVSCGEYRTAFADGAAEERTGVALLLPFKDVEPFVAEPKE